MSGCSKLRKELPCYNHGATSKYDSKPISLGRERSQQTFSQIRESYPTMGFPIPFGAGKETGFTSGHKHSRLREKRRYLLKLSLSREPSKILRQLECVVTAAYFLSYP